MDNTTVLIMEWLQDPSNVDQYGYVPIKKIQLYDYMKQKYDLNQEIVNSSLDKLSENNIISYLSIPEKGKNNEKIEYNFICLNTCRVIIFNVVEVNRLDNKDSILMSLYYNGEFETELVIENYVRIQISSVFENIKKTNQLQLNVIKARKKIIGEGYLLTLTSRIGGFGNAFLTIKFKNERDVLDFCSRYDIYCM